MNRLRISVLILISLSVIPALFRPALCQSKREEEELGRKNFQQIKEQLTFSNNTEEEQRIQRIGQTIAKIANTDEVKATYGSSDVYQFNYEFRLVQDDDVNAFSLPGGIICINTGAVELAESDDEIAGVIAHEIAHAAHHHLVKLLNKQSKVDKFVTLAVIAGILGRVDNRDLNNIMLGAQLMRIGKLSSYTQEAEVDADRTAVAYLAKSPYNPAGMLTFMKKMEKKRDENPTLPLGIYQTHPAPYKRAIAIAKAMKEEGLQIDMQQLPGVPHAVSLPANQGTDLYQVTINGKVLCEPANLSCGTTSKQRADDIAARINAMLSSGMSARDIHVDEPSGSLFANDKELLKITNEDSQSDMNNRALLSRARSTLEYAVWAEWLATQSQMAEDQSPEP